MIHPHLPRLALAIRQPWVWAILNQGKDIENRRWRTKVRGPICLHAALGMKDSEFDDCLDFVDEILPPNDDETRLVRVRQALEASSIHGRGGIVATADIVDCVTDHPSPWFFGPYGFVLANVQPIRFIRVRGLQQFFDWRRNLPEAS